VCSGLWTLFDFEDFPLDIHIMSRPPPFPRDASPRGERADEDRLNPPAASGSLSNSSTNIPLNGESIPLHDTSSRGDLASRHNSYISESWLREWGASSSSINDVNDFNTHTGYDCGHDSLRLDRSASFDDEPRHGNDPFAAEPSPTHRRIASTGGNRPPIDGASIIAQVFEEEDQGEMMLHHGLSSLHDSARITDWPAVAALSESNPEYAKYVGPDGWNALHHACDRRCPHVDVMDSLLSAHPESLVQTNDKGWTPLHRACRNKTPRDVVRLLLRKYPELGKRAAAMRCNDGRSALHYALLYDAPEGVVDLLLQADPGAVLDEDDFGVSPLASVWDKYANSFDGRRTLQTLLRPFEGEGWDSGGNVERDYADRRKLAERKVKEAMEKKSVPLLSKLQAKWQKANILLRAYFHFPLQEDKATERGTSKVTDEDSSKLSLKSPTPRKRKWRMLHATSAIKCHPTLFLLARAYHPEEALEVDEGDLLGGGRDEVSCRTALHFAAMSPSSGMESQKVIKVLIKLNLNATSHADGHGSLPLHLISQNDRKLDWSNDGARDISNAYPAAASVRDSFGKTSLHCAASSAKHCTHSTAPLPEVPTQTDGSVIGNLALVNGTAASITDNTGRLPLHYIAEHGEEWNVEAQFLLHSYPAAVRIRAGASTANKLPLHLAASSPDARPSLITNLLDANPRAASIVDGHGRLPLHHAVDSGRTTWDRGIDSIYLAFPPAISAPEENSSRWTVLHTAAASLSAGCELIKHILSLNENAASTADGEGKHPLHLACDTNRPWEEGGIKAIFEADPSVALIEDAKGMLPFHVAALRDSVSCSPSTLDAFADSETDDIVPTEDVNSDDLEALDVLFNLLIAQPSIVQL